MNISKIKVGSTTYNLKDSNAISLNTISSWAQAGNSDTIPSSKLPSYVDDVLEYASTSSFPETGESGKIYVATDTNKTYRWGGSSYVVISETLAVGTTEGTAYDGAAGAALKSKLDGIEAGAQTHRAPSAAEVKTALGTGSGTTKYLREDGTWATPPDTNTWPTATSQLTNDSGYITGITSAMVTSALGYTPPSSDTNTVTSINGKTGAIAAADMAAVLTAAGYALTDTNTWPSYTSQLTNDSGYITSSGSCNYANSSGSAGSTGAVTIDNTIVYGRGHLQYALSSGSAGTDPTVYQNPDTDWWSHIIMNHSNGNGYYNDLAFCFHSPSIKFRRVEAGTCYGWYDVITSANIGLQSVNYANSAGSVAWGNVSGRPTAVSSFTNDSGYITSSGSCNYATSAGSASSASSASVASKVQASVGDTGSYEIVRGDMNNDQFRILIASDASNAGWAEIATADDGTEPIYVSLYTGVFSSLTRRAALLDGSGNTTFPGTVYSGGYPVITSANIGSQSVNYANSAGSAPANGGNSSTVNGHTVNSDVPAGAVFTDTNTWRPITNTYTGSDQSTSVSQYGTNALYNALVNGYASSAGNADTLDGYHYNNLPYLTAHQDISGKVDKVSGSRPGVTKLYRSDSDDAYNVQTSWTGSYWYLRGYYGDTYHAGCQVDYAGYAGSAGSAPASDVYSWAKASTKPSYSYSEISGTPGSLPASDVYAWAKASSKPGYSYGEISYSTWTGTTSGALSLDLSTYPLYCITLNGNVSSVSISGAPAASHSGHVIFYNSGSSDYTVNIAHGSGSIKCPEAKDIALTVKAGGYAEIDILHVSGVAYFVRGV